MRTRALLVGLAACSGTDAGVDYPRLAAVIGASVATPGAGGETGALADCALIARGGMPAGFSDDGSAVTGTHDGVRYSYMVLCEDLSGIQTACSPVAGKALAMAAWSTPALHLSGLWTIDHLQGDVASVTGRSSLRHTSDGLDVNDDRNEAFLLDLASYQPRDGAIAAELSITSDDDRLITGSIAFDATRLATLSLPGNVFQIDLDTGDVVPISIPR